MNKIIINIFNAISRYFKANKDTCRLLEVNLSSQEVKFQIKMKLPILKCSISDAINDLNLISHISAIEACYLGGHYGRMINASWYDEPSTKKVNRTMTFLMKNSAGRYQILYIDRSGNIGFYDRKLQKEFIESPLSLANNQNLISLFNSSQACYIGILAGLHVGKAALKQDATDKFNGQAENKFHLRLVK